MAPQYHSSPRPCQEATDETERGGQVPTTDDTPASGDTPATDDTPASGDEVAVTVTPVECSSHDSADVSAAIERERLRARTRALERELVASERHRQALIERYEWVLAERESDDSNRSGTTTHPSGTVRSRLRRLFFGE
ncbi:hypothetical protein [Halovivax cerinus]|uniref:Uncharacterized protein n=1 Tax=Halovivax cerinus TaxID=1487865 RepID=A0ABD5NK97_9EURY|nr:hypothetical protein [Halovivax cerinus]